MPSIYSLQQNLVVNSNFTSGSSTGWTYSEDDPSGIATSEFNVSGGDDNPGVWYLESNDSETDSEYTIVGNLTNDGGVWSDPGTLISATVPFSYKQTWGLAAPSTNLIKVFLIKPDTSEVLLFSRSSTADDAAYSSESIDVGINNFSSTGTYKIKLYNYVETSVADTPLIRNFWDDIGLVLEYLDEVAPEITIESPSNKSYNITSVWANLTLDEDGDWCGYSLDGAANITMSNTSATDWYILVESLSESSHNIVYSCNDTSGNMNSSAVTIYFTVDLTDPQYSLNQTNSTEAGADTLFSLYWEDNIALAGYIFSFDNCTGIFENDSYIEMTGTENWSNVSKWINSTVGCTIQWRVYANDTAGNMNVSDIYSFNTIDSTPPIITIEYPLNRSYNSTSVWANLTLNEDGDWCGYSLDGAANVTMSNTSTEDWYILVESLSESSHYITYSCNDTAGNMNSSEVTVYFSVDVTEPNLYISSPDNITYKDKQIDLNVSADEDIDAWRYSLNGNANVTFDPNTTITAAEGVNNITVYANDTAGNLNSTTVYFSFNTTLEVVLEEPSTSFTTAII
ncbi:MAG: hypothetical protein KAR51_01290, partial [Candidatus Aenigmarchaeota archaeon]|nr:hypothetical protein [Candidatus Aenigmarchaeota archaeon]